MELESYLVLNTKLNQLDRSIELDVDWHSLFRPPHGPLTINSDARLYGFVLQEVFVNALRALDQELPDRELKILVINEPDLKYPRVTIQNTITQAEFNARQRKCLDPSQPPPHGETNGWGRHGIWAYFKQVYKEDVKGYFGPVLKADDDRPDTFWAVVSIPLIPSAAVGMENRETI